MDCRGFVERGELDRIGELMAENWRIKKQLASTISNPDLDRMVDLAQRGGAVGCKICGAGGGGFLLVYCRPEKQDALRRAQRLLLCLFCAAALGFALLGGMPRGARAAAFLGPGYLLAKEFRQK